MSNSGCPTFPHNVAGQCSPGANSEMFMNYMDYSDATCVVMFSNGQKARMLAAINTFRSSLTTSNGCTSLTVGINKFSNNQNFTVFPNPSTDNFQIEMTAPSKVVNVNIYNHLGTIVKQINSVNNFPYTVNTTELSSGIYFLKITSDHTIHTQKIVVSK